MVGRAEASEREAVAKGAEASGFCWSATSASGISVNWAAGSIGVKEMGIRPLLSPRIAGSVR